MVFDFGAKARGLQSSKVETAWVADVSAEMAIRGPIAMLCK